MEEASTRQSAVEHVAEHIKRNPKAGVLIVGKRHSLKEMVGELVERLRELEPTHRSNETITFANGATANYMGDALPERARGMKPTCIWVDSAISQEMLGVLRSRLPGGPIPIIVEARKPYSYPVELPEVEGLPIIEPPKPYSPPAELLERASLELSRATKREVRGAELAYNAYNRAVGGRSAATGAPLPEWEQNPNALVKYGWLAASQAAQAAPLREVDEVERQLEALKVAVGATFNTLAQHDSLGPLGARMLGAATAYLQSNGMEALAIFLTQCAEGQAEVDAHWAKAMASGEKAATNAPTSTASSAQASGLSPYLPVQYEQAVPVLTAMFQCGSVTASATVPGLPASETLSLFAVHGEANREWSQYTPSARLEMTITNPIALGKVQPGGVYRVTLGRDGETAAVEAKLR